MSERAGTGSTAARNMDLLVGYVLIVGVLSSLGLLAAGLAWHWCSTGTRLDYDLAGTTVFGLVVTDFRQLAAGAWRPRLPGQCRNTDTTSSASTPRPRPPGRDLRRRRALPSPEHAARSLRHEGSMLRGATPWRTETRAIRGGEDRDEEI